MTDIALNEALDAASSFRKVKSTSAASLPSIIAKKNDTTQQVRSGLSNTNSRKNSRANTPNYVPPQSSVSLRRKNSGFMNNNKNNQTPRNYYYKNSTSSGSSSSRFHHEPQHIDAIRGKLSRNPSPSANIDNANNSNKISSSKKTPFSPSKTRPPTMRVSSARSTGSASSTGSNSGRTSKNTFSSPFSEPKSVAEETREFARKQLQWFRACEEKRVTSYRAIRGGLRNIETLIQDIPLADQLAQDMREKMPSENECHLKMINTALHRKILDLEELLTSYLSSDQNLRKRLEIAEARATAAENKIIDLQAQLFSLEMQSATSLRGNRKF